MKKDNIDQFPPFTCRQINRLLIIFIILLALFSGYFHAKYTNEVYKTARLQKKLLHLQEKYDTVLEEATPAATQLK